MRLLITTQIVDKNNPVLGFFHRWIEEFAKHCEQIEVICLYEGEHTLPRNVTVHSLGKEKGDTSSLIYGIRFLKLIFALRHTYDTVFVHMNPEYVVLGGVWWRLWHKRIALWYLHKSVDLKLRIATMLTDVVLTASKESFRLASPKVRIVGHGIDTTQFEYRYSLPDADNVRLITVGRLSPAKKPHVLIEVAHKLVGKIKNSEGRTKVVVLDIVGAALPQDRTYTEKLAEQIAILPAEVTVFILGAKKNEEISGVLRTHDLFIHASTGTGSLDKTVLEALMCGVPVISSSEAFQKLLSPYGLFVQEGTDEETACRIADAAIVFLSREDQELIRKTLHNSVVENYSLVDLIPRILTTLEHYYAHFS